MEMVKKVKIAVSLCLVQHVNQLLWGRITWIIWECWIQIKIPIHQRQKGIDWAPNWTREIRIPICLGPWIKLASTGSVETWMVVIPARKSYNLPKCLMFQLIFKWTFRANNKLESRKTRFLVLAQTTKMRWQSKLQIFQIIQQVQQAIWT